MRTRLWITLASLAALTMPVAIALSAGSHFSRGDAEAVLAAYPTGGGAIHVHASESVNVGPARASPFDGLSIRPFVPDVHYCADDWHAIAWALIDFEVFEFG